MLENTSEFHCPTCNRNLGFAENFPESCFRCGTDLFSLKKIVQEATNSYRRGCLSMRSGDYSSAKKFFVHSCNLWDTEKSRRAVFFSNLLVTKDADSQLEI